MTAADFVRAYQAAVDAGDIDETLALIDEHAVYWFRDGTSHVGKRAVEAAIRANAERIKHDDYRISEVHWLAESDDVAACTFRFAWSGIVDGASTAGSGRGTLVIERRNARWVVVHEHLSACDSAH